MTISKRELQTARLVRMGYTNKQIADCMGLTQGTIKVRLHTLYRKLGLRNRADLAVWYVRNERGDFN